MAHAKVTMHQRRKSLRLDVIISQGNEARQLLWMENTGKDIYASVPHIDVKKSYHKTGLTHTKHTAGTSAREYRIPLSDLKDRTTLFSCWIRNEKEWFDDRFFKVWKGKKSDHTVYLDLTTVDTGAAIGAEVGIVPAGDLSQLHPSSEAMLIPRFDLQKLSIDCRMEPWIYCAVYIESESAVNVQSSEKDLGGKKAKGFLPEPGFGICFCEAIDGEIATILSNKAKFGSR